MQNRYTPTRVGTTLTVADELLYDSGTPPLAWGQPRGQWSMIDAIRYTPTRVGTPPLLCSTSCESSVHPHSRGDNANATGATERAFGTPPLAWGQRPAASLLLRLCRYTPTRVGTTLDLAGHSFVQPPSSLLAGCSVFHTYPFACSSRVSVAFEGGSGRLINCSPS